MNSKPAWANCTVKLGDLIPWENNPRYIKEGAANNLRGSFDDFGQVGLIVIGPHNEVYDGHQRLSVLMDQYGPEYEVEARRASRELSEDERRKLMALLHVGAVGSLNWDALASWDVSALVSWGFDTEALQGWNNDAANLALMIGAEVETEAPEFDPVDASEQPRLDQKKPITCPHCGMEFIPE